MLIISVAACLLRSDPVLPAQLCHPQAENLAIAASDSQRRVSALFVDVRITGRRIDFLTSFGLWSLNIAHIHQVFYVGMQGSCLDNSHQLPLSKQSNPPQGFIRPLNGLSHSFDGRNVQSL